MTTGWGEIQFLTPVWLSLWPVSVLAILFIYWRGHLARDALLCLVPGASAQTYFHPQAQALARLKSTPQPGRHARRHIGYLLTLLAIVSGLHLALAQPYRYGEKIPPPPEYRDVIFMVDTSVTMVLRDYVIDGQPVNRLTMLQSVLEHFTQRLSGSRMGIVVFSEQAHTLVPLTADKQLVQTMLRRLEITLTGRTSDVSKGIIYTYNQLQADAHGQRPERTVAEHKPVLILITDVNRPVRQIDPRAAAALVAQAGFSLHTIAIGAATDDAVQEDYSSLIYEPANIQLLEEIAQNGRGRFFHATDTESLQAAIATIQSASARERQPEPRYVPLALYYWPLGTAIALWIVLQLAIAVRRR